MWIFGFRPVQMGAPLPGAVLFVANHVSWVDICILHSQRMMGFVAKREIASWPLVGWLAARGQTIFHQRGNTESLGGVMQVMADRLRGGKAVGVFPEGRTRGGHEVGPFHARIFQAAVETGVPVQPVALVYGLKGDAQTIVAFGPGESFFANFLRLLGEPARRAEVHFRHRSVHRTGRPSAHRGDLARAHRGGHEHRLRARWPWFRHLSRTPVRRRCMRLTTSRRAGCATRTCSRCSAPAACACSAACCCWRPPARSAKS